MKRLHVIIRGRVQGVFFRAETQEEATRLGLTGWVRNRPDGTVEVCAEGDEVTLGKFLDWCRHGPLLARVDAVSVIWESAAGAFTRFDITR